MKYLNPGVVAIVGIAAIVSVAALYTVMGSRRY